jgi:DNA-binding response OmpR family regulator
MRRPGGCSSGRSAAEGYRVAVAADGGAALAAVERSMPDLPVLDVAMPGLDGLAVCRRLRQAGLALPIRLLTARDAVPDRVAGRPLRGRRSRRVSWRRPPSKPE